MRNKLIDFEQICKDYNIPYKTEGKNCSPGWVQINCPKPECGDTGFHGGVNTEAGYYNCWKCGAERISNIIKMVLGLTSQQAYNVVRKYQKQVIKKRKKALSQVKKVKWPEDIGPMRVFHKKYLKKRKFNCDRLIRNFNLKGTGRSGAYKFRIIAPIYYQKELVSYQGRDVTGLAPIKYKACRKDLELVHHKHILYNIDNAKEKVIVCEGITDVWRMGHGSVATFGIGYTQEQLILLMNFKKVFLLFDADKDAQARAETMAWDLSVTGGDVEIVSGLNTDPGDLTFMEAVYIRKELLGEK